MQHLPETRLEVTGEIVRAYAELTQDFNPLHLDAAFAATTPLKTVIAHGTLSINLLWQSVAMAFGESAFIGANLQIRFLKPVAFGEVLVAGGHQSGQTPGHYEVWVRGADRQDRLAGTLSLNSPSDTGR